MNQRTNKARLENPVMTIEDSLLCSLIVDSSSEDSDECEADTDELSE